MSYDGNFFLTEYHKKRYMMKFFSDMANRRTECDAADVRYRTQTTEAPEGTDSAVIRMDRCICDISPSDSMYTGCTPDACRLQRYISMISLPVEKMIKETIHAMTVLDMQSLRGTVKLPASFLMAASVAAHGV